MFLSRRGYIPSAASVQCTALTGGYQNQVFRLRGTFGDWVVKRFRASDDVTLFPNSAAMEARALALLGPLQLAPRLVDFIEDAEAGEILIYEFYDGQSWPGGTAGLPATANDTEWDVRPVAGLLRRLHNISAGGFRTVPTAPREILAQGATFLPGVARRADLEKICPAAIDVPPLVTCCLLHTDVGPGNLILGSAGLRLIDWQCPALGDPAEDLCAFLSPAFQILYGCQPLSETQRAAFLDAYGDEATSRRLYVLEPFFHWRMAAYCAMRRHRYIDTRPQAAAAYDRAFVALTDILRRL